jgi:hypothetical protein
MQTECTPKLFEFEAVARRSVVAGFDGGNITSNAGALLLGHDGQDKASVSTRVPSPDDRAGACRTIAGGAGT